MKLYIIAGEASGDLHGSNLMRSIYAQNPEAQIRFWGGELMDSVYREGHEHPGCGLVKDYREGAVMGFVEILASAGKLLGNIAQCKKDIEDFNPDAVVYIDYPGFNLRIAKWAHKKGFKNIYYIAPKVWASREGRIRQLRRYIDKMLIIFPFEIKYFESKGITNFEYVGNPLMDTIFDSIDRSQTRAGFLQSNGLEDSPYIALLAGSRKGEIKTMMPQLTAFATKMHTLDRYKDYKFIIAGAPARDMSDYESYISPEQSSYIKVIFSKSREIVRFADAAIVNSGTASLETAILNTPQVVGYICGSFITYIVSLMLLRCKYISLGNLCVDKYAFNEFLQYDCNPEKLVHEVRNLIENETYRNMMYADYGVIRDLLRTDTSASDKAAEAIQKTILG